MTLLPPGSVRLADVALAEDKKASFFIEKQFPAIYREEGRELIELVKMYYRFLEENELQSVYNIRRIREYRDVDTTLESMLVFFKNKFMNGIFFDKDTRFVIKHMLDLYRRKGSTEGIELFFRLFFDSEALVYLPSGDILKPSTSLWKTGSFIQLYGISDTKIFSDIVNKKIFGDTSKAEAFVDAVYFLNIDSYTIPVLFISSVKGRFQGFDVIFSDDPVKIYGRVYGSVREVATVQSESFSGNNFIGDVVEITSSTGFGAKGRVSKVSRVLSGQIGFEIVNGGFGYTEANTTIELSTQTIFLTDPDPATQEEPIQLFIGERVRQVNSANTIVDGIVIGQRKTGVGIGLDYSTDDAIDSANTYFFEESFLITTLDRIENISVSPVFVTDPNNTSSAQVGSGSIINTEEISIITDLISNYLNVRLDSSNYSASPALLGMSGTRVNGIIPDANTHLNEAFVPENFDIGSISTLVGIDPGYDYFSDAFVIARENIISRFNLRDQVLRIEQAAGVVLFVNDLVTQTKTVKTFEGTEVDSVVRGKVVNVIGNEIYVTQLTFESFVVSEPIFKVGSDIPITIISRTRDQLSRPIGLNADINANVETVTGRIEEIEIIDSGFGYVDLSNANVYNVTRAERNGTGVESPDCVVVVSARDQGIAEGRWVSYVSHINQEKVIQDSFFYQDYSYEVTTEISPEEYRQEYIDLVHPAGLKLFTSFGKTDNITVAPIIENVDISVYSITELEFLSETNSVVLAENGFSYINIVFADVTNG
jgi:hypothetical protein